MSTGSFSLRSCRNRFFFHPLRPTFISTTYTLSLQSRSPVASHARVSRSRAAECSLPMRESERVRIFAFEAVIGRVCRRMAFVLAHNLSLFSSRERASRRRRRCSKERREHKWAHIRLSISLLWCSARHPLHSTSIITAAVALKRKGWLPQAASKQAPAPQPLPEQAHKMKI